MSFLKGFDLKDFLSNHKEWHALVEGFADEFCIRPCRYKPWDNKKNGHENLLAHIRQEHHYYNAGRVLGFAGLISMLTGMAIWVIRALT